MSTPTACTMAAVDSGCKGPVEIVERCCSDVLCRKHADEYLSRFTCWNCGDLTHIQR